MASPFGLREESWDGIMIRISRDGAFTFMTASRPVVKKAASGGNTRKDARGSCLRHSLAPSAFSHSSPAAPRIERMMAGPSAS